MAIGPVAHLDDVAGGKVEALLSRAEARDFIAVDALVTSGAFTREELLSLAASRDAGFDHSVFAQMLTTLDIYPDTELTAYGLTTTPGGRTAAAHRQLAPRTGAQPTVTRSRYPQHLILVSHLAQPTASPAAARISRASHVSRI